MVLETTHVTGTGTIRVTDFMHAFRDPGPHIVRIVDGIDGAVEMLLNARFGYGDLPPWTRQIGDALTMTAVGDALALRCDVPLTLDGHDPRAAFTIRKGERHWFELAWYPSHHDVRPRRSTPEASLEKTVAKWSGWAAQIKIDDGLCPRWCAGRCCFSKR